jgi:hypothetical protein
MFYGFSKLNLKGKRIILLGEFTKLRKAAENSSLHSEELSAATCRKCEANICTIECSLLMGQ